MATRGGLQSYNKNVLETKKRTTASGKIKQELYLTIKTNYKSKTALTSILKPLNCSLPNQPKAGSKRREEEPEQPKPLAEFCRLSLE